MCVYVSSYYCIYAVYVCPHPAVYMWPHAAWLLAPGRCVDTLGVQTPQARCSSCVRLELQLASLDVHTPQARQL